MWLFTVAKYFALANLLFGTVKCAKKNDADFDHYKYSGCSIGYNKRRNFSLSDGNGFGKNKIKLDADLRSCRLCILIIIIKKIPKFLGKVQ